MATMEDHAEGSRLYPEVEVANGGLVVKVKPVGCVLGMRWNRREARVSLQ